MHGLIVLMKSKACHDRRTVIQLIVTQKVLGSTTEGSAGFPETWMYVMLLHSIEIEPNRY